METPKEKRENLNQKYFDYYNNNSGKVPRYPDVDAVRFIYANFKAGDKIVDLGCSGGRHVKMVAENGFDAYGVDASPYAVEGTKGLLEKSSLKGEVKEGDLVDIPYEDNFFDGIICVATIFQNKWKDMNRIAEECYRILKLGGMGYFDFVTNKDWTFGMGKEVEKNTYTFEEGCWHASPDPATPPMTYHFTSKEEIEELFKKFTEVRIESSEQSYHTMKIEKDNRTSSFFKVLVKK